MPSLPFLPLILSCFWGFSFSFLIWTVLLPSCHLLSTRKTESQSGCTRTPFRIMQHKPPYSFKFLSEWTKEEEESSNNLCRSKELLTPKCEEERQTWERWRSRNPVADRLTHTHLPCAAASLVALVGLDSLVGPLPSAAAPSVSGVLRISLDVMDDMPVTAQPAQPDEAADGWAEDVTSFSEGQKKWENIKIKLICRFKVNLKC